MRVTTDMIAVGGLVIALIAGITGGLSGYISKAVQQGGEAK